MLTVGNEESFYKQEHVVSNVIPRGNKMVAAEAPEKLLMSGFSSKG